MLTATVSADGTLALPEALKRKFLPGDKVAFVTGEKGWRIVLRPQNTVANLFGCLSAYRPERPVTDADIRKTVATCACRGDEP